MKTYNGMRGYQVSYTDGSKGSTLYAIDKATAYLAAYDDARVQGKTIQSIKPI